MVFVKKTLDDMLKEINFSNPITLSGYHLREKINPDISYYLNTKNSFSQTIDSIFENVYAELSYLLGVPKVFINKIVPNFSELISNALDWGGGIEAIEYYLASGGVVINMIQKKSLNIEETLSKIQEGLYPSSRKSDEITNHGGGMGLDSMNRSELEISYQGLSTLVLVKRELVENNLKSVRSESKC